MGHCIGYLEFPCRTSEKQIMKFLNGFAFDPMETSRYHGNLKFHKALVLSNRMEAEKTIKSLDRGWYDDHAVMFKDGRKKKWLVKYEYHC